MQPPFNIVKSFQEPIYMTKYRVFCRASLTGLLLVAVASISGCATSPKNKVARLDHLEARTGAVIVGPWLEGENTTKVDVLVECESAAGMTVHYGTTTNYGMSAATSVCWTNPQASGDFIHRIKLKGLKPDRVYHCRLTGQGASRIDFSFETMPPPTNLLETITLASAPLAVRNAVATVASGREVERVNRMERFGILQFYVYIADTLGPQLLVVSANGETLINARVVPFANLPQFMKNVARTTVAGRLQVCRQSVRTRGPFELADSQSPYVFDYVIWDGEEDEPVYALVRETDGWVRNSYAYHENEATEPEPVFEGDQKPTRLPQTPDRGR